MFIKDKKKIDLLPSSCWRILFYGLSFFLIILVLVKAEAETLLQDNFDGSSLSSEWNVRTWPADGIQRRTEYNAVSQPPIVQDGHVRLNLDTYNSNAPGSTFLGSEIITQTKFSLDMSSGGGLEFEARIRLDQQFVNQPGLIAAFFTYGESGQTNQQGNQTYDEIDFEFLSNFQNDRLLINAWDADRQLGPDIITFDDIENLGGLDLTDWNSYKLRWFSDRLEWYVNNEWIFTKNNVENLADAEMPLYFNLWVPNANFTQAYGENFLPTADPTTNKSFYMDLDQVSVSAIPEPKHVALLFGLIAACVAVIRRKTKNLPDK